MQLHTAQILYKFDNIDFNPSQAHRLLCSKGRSELELVIRSIWVGLCFAHADSGCLQNDDKQIQQHTILISSSFL